jgi:hypothetical protein
MRFAYFSYLQPVDDSILADESILIKVYPLAIQGASGATWNESAQIVVLLAPLFKLLCTFKRYADKDSGETQPSQVLEDEMKALLTAGLIMFRKSSILGNLSAEKKIPLCHALFYATSWIRELVNTFSLSNDASVIENVMIRISHLIELEKILFDFVSGLPSWAPIGVEMAEFTGTAPRATLTPIAGTSNLLAEPGLEDETGIQSTATSVCDDFNV